MITNISDKIKVNEKNKKNKKSPLSETYTKYLKKEDIKLSPTKKSKPQKLEDIKIKVIKSPEIHKVNDSDNTKKPCKKKKINKTGKLKEKDILHNKKCKEIQKTEKIDTMIEKEIQKSLSSLETLTEDKVDKEDKKNKKKVKKLKAKDKKKQKSKRRRKLSKRHTRKRKISLKNSTKKEEIIKKDIETADKMSDDKIKQELEKKGIIIQGNQKQLMRDIFVFSNLGGIKVRKE